MTREGAPSNQPKAAPAAGTPIWVWIVYGLGVLAAVIFTFSLLFTLGAVVLSDREETPVSYDVSWPAMALWGAFVALALGTWLYRRRRRR